MSTSTASSRVSSERPIATGEVEVEAFRAADTAAGVQWAERMLDERRLRRVLEVGQVLVADLDLEAVLQRVLELARELTGAQYAALGILDHRRRDLERFLTDGIDAETHQAIGDLPRGRGVLGVLIDDPRPLRLHDVGAHPRSYGFPAGHPHMRSFLGVPVLIRGEAFGNLYLTDKQGSDAFDEADEELMVLLAGWAGIAIDNARSYANEQGRRTEVERALRALEATTTIARALGGETDLPWVLEVVAKRARALVEARCLVIMLVDGDHLVVQSVAGEVMSDPTGARLELAGSIGGQVISARRPERLGDVAHRLRHALAPYVEARTGLFVPMIFRGRAVGVLNAYDRGDGDEFTAEDERLLEAFAASAATAVATAQNVAEQKLHRSIEAAEHERTRWARELHDDTLQQMASVKMRLVQVERSLGSSTAARALRATIEQLDEGITGLRRLITDLRPAALDDLGIEAALRGLVRRVAGVSGLDVSLRVELDPEAGGAEERPEPLLEETLYRIVQEALSNVVKHARASRVQVSIVERERWIELTVRDDGRGIEGSPSPNGFGLVGMRERAELAGGVCTVEPAPGRGTLVTVAIPTGRTAQRAGDAAGGGALGTGA